MTTGDRQNVTLSIPKDLLTAARHAAVDRGVSLSAFLADVLSEALGYDDAYEQERRQQMELLDSGFDLGLHGKVPWSRDALHER